MPKTIEHATLSLLAHVHPNKDGIFAAPREARKQLKYHINWLVGSFGYRSLHEFRQQLAEDTPSTYLKGKAEAVTQKWVESYGLEYDKHVVQSALENAETQINLFTHNTHGLFKRVHEIQPINEVVAENNILTLLRYALNSPDSRVRFEAARKLYLTDRALANEHSRQDIQQRMDYLYNVLGEHIFTDPNKNNIQTQLQHVYFLSYHDTTDMRCLFTREIKPGETIDESMLTPEMRINTLLMRTWFDNKGNPHRVLFEPRTKNPEDQIIKELRNDTGNPHSIEDNLGAKLTFDSLAEAELFYKTLQSKPIPLSPSVYSIRDTIEEDRQKSRKAYKGSQAASAQNFEIIKYNIRIGNTTYEIQVNTIRTWIDYRLRDEICWEDYAVKRVVTSNEKHLPPVVELLFPKEIYSVDLIEHADSILRANQFARRYLSTVIPQEIRHKGRNIQMMSKDELYGYIDRLTDGLREITKFDESNTYIVIAEDDPSKLKHTASLLRQRMGIREGNVKKRNEIESIPEDATIIIFDDIYLLGKHIAQTKIELEARGFSKDRVYTAVLIADQTHKKRKLEKDHIVAAKFLDTQTTRVMFPFASEAQKHGSSSVVLITRKKLVEGETVEEILVEVLDDGSYKLTGGQVEDETPLERIIIEMEEELSIQFAPEAFRQIGNPIRTICEPHPNLTKRWKPMLEQHVFQLNTKVKIDESRLPRTFRFVDIRSVYRKLRWEGQRELWNKLIRQKTIRIN